MAQHKWNFISLALVFSMPLSVMGNEHDVTQSNSKVEISRDGQSLLVKKNALGSTVEKNVISQCGKPAVGEGIIRHIEVNGQEVVATYGKHCSAILKVDTLELKCMGCD